MPAAGSSDEQLQASELQADADFLDDSKLEQEYEELKQEAERLRVALDESEGLLPGLLQEANDAEASNRAESEAAAAAEERRHDLLEELAKLTCEHPKGSKVEAAASSNSRSRRREKTKPSPRQGWNFMAEREAMVEAQVEVTMLTTEIAQKEQEFEDMRRANEIRDLTALEDAESVACGYYEELDVISANLHAAEGTSHSLREEHSALEAHEAPLREWVRHAERELQEARAENGMLAVQLLSVLDRKAELQREDLMWVHPLEETGMDIESLEERERESIARRALLNEEIHATRRRRADLVSEAASVREEESLLAQLRRNEAVMDAPTSEALVAPRPPSCLPPRKSHEKPPWAAISSDAGSSQADETTVGHAGGGHAKTPPPLGAAIAEAPASIVLGPALPAGIPLTPQAMSTSDKVQQGAISRPLRLSCVNDSDDCAGFASSPRRGSLSRVAQTLISSDVDTKDTSGGERDDFGGRRRCPLRVADPADDKCSLVEKTAPREQSFADDHYWEALSDDDQAG
eukprot:TRINITY_DN74914_c0_g1_i1.p1 TRINITY_DN74914_c0_g1~~TRINITY_DN74914_c0_g1_i1.p1  ORF type:complete len:521 (+),score=115.75 TRINITY_DN74914_c0_g1_i1:187-1749(+)